MRTPAACVFLILLPALALAEVTTRPGVEARHQGIDAATATALTETISAGRVGPEKRLDHPHELVVR